MILLGIVAIAVLAVASYEIWRRGAAREPRDSLDAVDPPPLIYSDDRASHVDMDGDGGDGGGDA